MLESSAVETTGTAGVASASDLDFFDALESRRLVCQDDVLHAALLLGNGESGTTFASRVTMARRLGYIDAGFNRPAHEAATMGEVAKIMLRISDGAGSAAALTQEQAVLRLAGRGLMPAQARPYQGLTGAQFMTVLGGVRASMGNRERPHLQVAPEVVASPAPAAARSAPASSTRTTNSSAIASAEGGAAAPAEPLPASALDASIEKPKTTPVTDTGERSVKPAALEKVAEPSPNPQPPVEPAPVVKPTEPDEPPVPPPPPSPTKPRVWVPGKPLRKSGN